MRRVVKYLVTRFYKPLLVRYLSKTRKYTFKGVQLLIPPEVFHPAFFFSTKYLLRYISGLPLQQSSFLELGAGSGLISIFVAGKGSNVMATDINPVAVEYLEKNGRANNVKMEVVHSDLFEQIPSRTFDIIAINPPYYKKQPQTFAEHAWYCGENGEYFDRLFHSLPDYMHGQSTVLMTLSDGCDETMIRNLAIKNGCRLNRVHSMQNLMEEIYIFKIERN
ncbi:release factor glutamine methyltransferase [Chitinophaga rupis]|uniref:Release factor glutamine methyltransferase n=1 Tax=Chitinophaga rupis TaxID=573321 RepID=A0A1H7XGZ7_9BACT|nr:HemK2/MTQ2 family protein methyltransferase [Chitinophaga rupis]SEM32884.1 release factor glutamine methyltransferase [Chitinophaga rupis]